MNFARWLRESVDTSLLDMLDILINDGKDDDMVFNPHAVLGQLFTVEYVKTDGTHGKLTGRLVAPNYEGTPGELEAYCIGLLNQDLIRIYTDKGWRSFYASKVFYYKIEGK
jgi:hypothetical protein